MLSGLALVKVCHVSGVLSTPSSLPGWAGGSGSCMWGGACFASLPPPSSSFVGLICLACLDDVGLVSPWGVPDLTAVLVAVLLRGYGVLPRLVYKCAIMVELLCHVECGFLRPLFFVTPVHWGVLLQSGGRYCAIPVFAWLCGGLCFNRL